MLRFLITTGLLLMAVGFGAAGWQYWQGMAPGAPAAATDRAAAGNSGQSWLVSDTGMPVPRADADAYLVQERLVPGRRVTLTLTARLADLLASGEKLPEAPYLQVLADIRAPIIAEALCPALTDRVAQACTVNAARVIEGSVDAIRGTAGFRIELVYRLNTDNAGLPDLAMQVLAQRELDLEIAPEGAEPPAAVLAAAVETASAACGEIGPTCRLLGIDLDLRPEAGSPSGRARIAWLSPMPAGMQTVPPLVPENGG